MFENVNPEWIVYIIAIASAISAVLPMPQTTAFKIVRGIIDVLALNVANAKNKEKPPKGDPMKLLVFFGVLFLVGLATTDPVFAATLSGTVPTTRANNDPLPRAELKAIRIYKQGSTAPIATITAASITGATFSVTVPDCTGAIYTATALDAGDLESDPSNTASLVPVRATCAPKPVTGLSVN